MSHSDKILVNETEMLGNFQRILEIPQNFIKVTPRSVVSGVFCGSKCPLDGSFRKFAKISREKKITKDLSKNFWLRPWSPSWFFLATLLHTVISHSNLSHDTVKYFYDNHSKSNFSIICFQFIEWENNHTSSYELILLFLHS